MYNGAMEKKDPAEVFKQICDLISIGYSAGKACEKLGVGDEIFYHYMRVNEDAEGIYLQAREKRSHARFERVDNILQNVEDGIIEHNKARVMIDAVKWQTAKEKGKVYGDSTIVRGDKDNPIELALSGALEAAMIRRQQLAAPDIIEGEVLPVIEVKKPADYI